MVNLPFGLKHFCAMLVFHLVYLVLVLEFVLVEALC